jgi:hypothetical protein
MGGLGQSEGWRAPNGQKDGKNKLESLYGHGITSTGTRSANTASWQSAGVNTKILEP